ncbi:DUF2726 domain-containing protein [Kushneria indalinina]|uniref:Uncharacterized protein DUF2726 n=1 Tax=Kushneria indalinina DSM 14324 TaxID=1122140 RepID=A0A3D9DRM2_9GAMM|nr:DUF2726 domain-containing protein [Kushneria indalinina]REC93367.1 uncharacterized protein DUF2726 [Kushneria indalinina DSM 14324]
MSVDPLILKVAILILVAALALVVIGILFRLVKGFRSGKGQLPYAAQKQLNTPAEQAFFAAVDRAVEGRAMIACKVRIADVLQVSFRKRNNQDQRWWRFFRLISSKHVDLVICESRGGRFLAAIELDDRSHNRSDRKRRDRFVDQAFASAGLPLLRFAASGSYDVREIQQRLEPHLSTPGKDH